MWSVMNSLNIVSRLTNSPPPSPPRSRQPSSTNLDTLNRDFNLGSINEKLAQVDGPDVRPEESQQYDERVKREEEQFEVGVKQEDQEDNEKTPLLSSNSNHGAHGFKEAPGSRVWSIPKRVAQAMLRGVQVVFTTITAPGRYIIACFYDEQGHFSAILPLRNLKTLFSRRKRKSTAHAVGLSSAPDSSSSDEKPRRRQSSRRSTSVDSNASSSIASSDDGEGDAEKREDSPARHTRSRTAASAEPTTANVEPRQRIKIKHNDEAQRKRRAAAAASTNRKDLDAVASALKSPSSPSASTASKMTRYPRAPAPPRPLVPRRQPSYTLSYSADAPKKTLIIDLDETLIHSMAKGGRMSTGHMVEVRLNTPVPTSQPGSPSGTVALGPGVPILYYVHERPGCHDFLRKISRWYNLVVFTASVQEYADPVIDWLEREKKYFGGRYYRQHCTLRNGAYIKDLAQVEPDLSRVMILDNSPMSYIFHEDNAIPIEGWISDPTDNDLLHLVPLLEGLQYVTDVRALLALRQGQAQQA